MGEPNDEIPVPISDPYIAPDEDEDEYDDPDVIEDEDEDDDEDLIEDEDDPNDGVR